MVTISGNTFPVKDQLKALGGKWDAVAKVWSVPDDKADEARAIVASAGEKKPRADGGSYRPSVCRVCGHRATGRYGDVIYRSGECKGCYEERKMGY